MTRAFWTDESGAILSAEIVLILTLLVIGMIVGLAELQDAVVNELNDVGEAIGSLNQSYFFHGQLGRTTHNAVKSFTRGSFFEDRRDNCDWNECMISCDPPMWENPKICN